MDIKELQDDLTEVFRPLARSQSGDSIEQLMDQVIDRFGGPGAVAEAIVDTYRSAKVGSTQQVRMMDYVIKLMVVVSAKQENSGAEELDYLTEKQLEAMLAKELGRETIRPEGKIHSDQGDVSQSKTKSDS